MNNIPMKFDFTKSLNEQLPTFNYYENEYKMMALNIQNLRQELQRKDNIINELNKDLEYYKHEEELYRYYQQENPRLMNNWNELKKYVDKLYESETYHSIGEILDKINELEEKVGIEK